MAKRIAILLLFAASMLTAGEDYVLKRVEWERDTVKSALLHLRFTFNQAPAYFPVFFEEAPPSIRLSFSDTRLDSLMATLKSFPPPLTGLALTEKKLAAGGTVVMVGVGLDRKYPFQTKLDRKTLTLSIEGGAGLRTQKVVHESNVSQPDAITVRNLSVQSLESNVEVLLAFDRPVMGFSAYVLDSLPRLILDLPGVVWTGEGAEEKIEVPPIKGLKVVTQGKFTSLVFSIDKKCEIRTLQKKNRISVILPREKSLLEKNRKWIYLSASALMLGGLGGAILMGGSEGTPEKDKTDGGSGTGDDWNDPPPNPDAP